jgi:hypothetical protein
MGTFLIRHIGTLLFIITTSANISAQQAVTKITYPNALSENDIRQEYFVELLDLALKQSEKEYGPYELTISESVLPSPRVPQMMLERDLINVMSSPETKSLNDRLLKIPIPLLMGIQGLRLSFIHKDNKALFENTLEAESLEHVIFGQGNGWVDTKVLKDNSLQVQTTTIYDSLFGMVAQKRVHAFPRGLNEIYRELEAWQEQYPDLSVDQHMALYYPLPVNFYVNPKDESLKERLMVGLNNAKDSGKFDQLFHQYFSETLEKANIDNRTIFILDNQYIPNQFSPEYTRHLLPAIQALLRKQTKKTL